MITKQQQPTGYSKSSYFETEIAQAEKYFCATFIKHIQNIKATVLPGAELPDQRIKFNTGYVH